MADGYSFAILGGYGQLGRAVAKLLLDRGAPTVTIAGRSRAKADETAIDLAGRNGTQHVLSECTESEDKDGLAALLAKHDVLVHTAPLSNEASKALREALLRTGGRVVLVSHDAETVTALRKERLALEQAGASVVLDAGADPGLPGLIGHLAAEDHGAAEEVEVAARYRAKRVGRAGLEDILDGATNAAWVYDDGWRPAGFFEVRRKRWPGGLGTSLALPVFLPELDAVRERHGLRKLILWHGGLNGLADLIVSLRRVFGRLVPRRAGLAALTSAMRFANPPPYGLAISGVAIGEDRRRTITLSHPDVYEATALIAAWSAELLTQEQGLPSVRFAFEQLSVSDPREALTSHGFDLRRE